MKRLIGMIKNNKILSMAISVEAVLLVICIWGFFQPRFYYDMQKEDIPVIAGAYDENHDAYIDDSIGEFGFFTCGPNIPLKQGVYDVVIHYETDSFFPDDIHINTVNCMGSNSVYNDIDIKYGKRCLNPGNTEEHFVVWTTKDIENFQVATIFSGNGSLSISRIEIAESYATYTLRMFYIIIFGTFVNMLILFWKKRNQNQIDRSRVFIGMFIVGITVFASYPALSGDVFFGDDLRFHLLRIEGIKEGLLDGQFPVKIQPTQMNGYGFAASVLYGDLFLYIPAVLRIIGFSVQESYNCFLILVNFATAMVSYLSYKGIFKNEKCALLGTLVYMFAPYRLINLYYRAAVGEYLAMIFFPLLFYGFYQVLYGNVPEKKPAGNWIWIVIALTGILESHNISCIIVAFILVLSCLWKINRVLQKRCFVELVWAAIVTILLNAGFLVPFLDYYMNKVCRVSEGILEDGGIQGSGIEIHQLFTIFTRGDGGIGSGSYHMIGITIGIVSVISVFWFTYYILVGQKSHWIEIGKFAWVFAILTICCSLKIFPWHIIENHLGIFKTVQFSWRFLAPASFFASIIPMCIFMSIEEKKNYREMFFCCMAVLSLLSAGAFLGSYLYEQKPLEYHVVEDLPYFCSGTETNEYVPYGVDTDTFKKDEIFTSSEAIKINQYRKKYLRIQAEVENTEETEGYAEFPMFYFPGITAEGDNGKLICGAGENKVVRVMIPAGFKGEVKVYFNAPFPWKLSYVVTCVTAIYIFLCLGNINYKKIVGIIHQKRMRLKQ